MELSVSRGNGKEEVVDEFRNFLTTESHFLM